MTESTASASSLASGYDGFVCDLDGVVYRGPLAIDHAVEALTSLRGPIQYATNNASRPPAEVAAHLADLGLPVVDADVATSSEAGAASLARQLPQGSAVLAIGGPGVALAITAAGLRPMAPGAATEPIAAVLQGYGPQVTATDLAHAAYAIQGGALWVATNVDLTLPTDSGIAPGNGSLVAAVATACGRQPDEIVGKPYPALYDLTCARLGTSADRTLALGDRLDTDIAGAVAAGLDSLLVLTGVSSLRQAMAADAGEWCTFLAPDLRALHEHLPVPAPDGDEWVCGDDRGRIDGTSWVTERQGTDAQRMTNRLYAVRSARAHGLAESDLDWILHDLPGAG